MTNNENYIENQPELNREMQEMISGSSIAWSKSKEEIWPEMLGKMEGRTPASRGAKTIYLQVAKYAAAAVFLILLGISAVMYFFTKTIETQVAQNTDVFLPDNSRVLVNPQSVLSYKPLLWKLSRSVKLEGEAFFEVQKGEKFEVVSKKGKTVVLGTQFEIYSRGNDYNVNCVSGRVKVVASAHQNEVTITGGQEAILKPDGTFEIIDKASTEPAVLDKIENQTIEEELNDVLKDTPAQLQNESQENKNTLDTKQATIKKEETASKEQTSVKEQIKADLQNVAKEQNKSQDQTLEDLQSKEQPKTATQEQTGNKDKESDVNQGQQTTTGKSTGNQKNIDKLRPSLTPEQIKILENQQMSKEEKRKAFMESLSPEQHKLLKEQKEANKNELDANDKIKEQQKQQTREQLREGSGKETQEQQKQQNIENKGGPNPGTESGPGSGGQTGKGN